jgi:hypothetical protein
VRHAHAVRQRAGEADGVRRAARRLGVVGRVGPQFERHRGGVVAAQQRGHGRIDATAHRDERPPRIRGHHSGRPRGGAERTVQGVGRQVRGVELARAEPTELVGDRVRAHPCGVQHGLAAHERDRRRARRGHRAAARCVEPGRRHVLAVHAQ